MQRSDNSKEYYNSDENGIYPLSQVDAEILDELEKIIELYDGGDRKLFNIIKKYKKGGKDIKVREELISLRSKIENEPLDLEEGDENGGEDFIDKLKKKWPKEMIDLEGNILEVSRIRTVEKDSNYIQKQSMLEYTIVFNRMEMPYGTFCNKIISFLKESQRDKVWEELKVKLKSANVKFL